MNAKRLKRWMVTLTIVLAVMVLTACGSEADEETSATSTDNETTNEAQGEEEKVVINYSEIVPADHPLISFADRFAENATTNSDGSVEVNVHHSGTLAEYGLEPASSGIADIVQLAPSMVADFVPWISVLDAAYLVEEGDHFDKVTDPEGEIYQTIDENMKEANIKLIGFFNLGPRDMTANDPVHSPEDLEGMKMRAQPSEYWSVFWNAFGAAPVPMSSNEIVTAASTGVIDGQENHWHDIIGQNFYEVQDYLMKTEHVLANVALWMNLDKWNSMSENQQQAVMDSFTEAKEWFHNDLNQNKVEEYKEILAENDVTIITEEDGLQNDEFKKAAEDYIYAEYEETWGDWVQKIKDLK